MTNGRRDAWRANQRRVQRNERPKLALGWWMRKAGWRPFEAELWGIRAPESARHSGDLGDC